MEPHRRSLGERYATHNRSRGRGFVYGGAERVHELRRAIGSLPSGPILDLGCRDGALAHELGLPAERTFGADIDGEALDAARVRLHPCIADLWRGLPFQSGSFDLVVAGEIVEHVPFPDALVQEMARVLRPGGRVVGSVPNAFRLKNRALFATGHWFDVDPTHLRQFSPATLRRLLDAVFVDVRITPCVGRWAHLWPRMLANDLVWMGTRP